MNDRPRAPLAPFESLDDLGRAHFSRDVYEQARAQQEFDIVDIRYSSDGLEVPGVLVRPKRTYGRRWPAIIFNRGGTGDYGKINDLTIVELYLYAKAGFVVIASDYRFHAATSKRDEWGGADLNDVANLVPLLQSMDVVDPLRLFMLGVSRGGMMRYMTLAKRTLPIRAAAVIAGPSDLEALGRYQRGFVDGDQTYDGWSKVWPDYAQHAGDLYRDRSPIFWADKLLTPILILHSREDRLVPVEHAFKMADALPAEPLIEEHVSGDSDDGYEASIEFPITIRSVRESLAKSTRVPSVGVFAIVTHGREWSPIAARWWGERVPADLSQVDAVDNQLLPWRAGALGEIPRGRRGQLVY